MVENNHQRFENLTVCYLEQMFRLAYARVGNAQDAEDIVQEAYIKAFRSFDKLRREEDIKSWLTQILINTARDHVRKNTRSVPTTDLTIDVEENLDSAAQSSPEQKMCEDEIDPALLEALQSVPENLLTPLLLREIYDASYSEIAAVLDIPIGTVMSRLFRARSLIRKHLSEKVEIVGIVENFKQTRQSSD